MSEQEPAEVAIHNGEIIGENPLVKTETPPRATPVTQKDAPPELDPNQIAAKMAQVISEQLAQQPKPTPMDIVNALLQLAPEGKKLVWTRFDVYQCFGLYSAKVAGGKPGGKP